MELRAAVATFAAVLCLASFASRTSATCTFISTTSDKCRSASYIKLVLPGDIKIHKPSTFKLIKLPWDMSKIYWYCGSSIESTGLGGMANQLWITYQSDGSIHWTIYKCPRGCKIKDTTYDQCRSSNFILVESHHGQKIYKNSHQVVNLPGLQSEVRWYCGNSRERTAWHKFDPISKSMIKLFANQLSITYSNDGRIKWVIKICY